MIPPPPAFPPHARIPSRTIEFVDLHANACDCPMCEAYAHSRPAFADALNRVAGDFLLGLAGAHVVVWIYDAITHGPGLLAMYGL